LPTLLLQEEVLEARVAELEETATEMENRPTVLPLLFTLQII